MPAEQPGSVSPAGLEPGVVLSARYRLGALVRRGGMGEVWTGEDVRLGRPVAVKVVRPEVGADPRVRGRFEAEARAAARLRSPHAVAVFDCGEDGARLYIVMECLPGESLADDVAAGPLVADAVRRMGMDVLGALGEAHAIGLVHRDVKPGNILRAPGIGWKLGDFGIARSLDAATDLTSTGMVVGTPAYLAPERLAGAPGAPASDLWSLGVVMYEALAGRRPFQGADALSTAAAVAAGHPPPLASVSPDLPAGLVAVIERAMTVDPGRRYPDAASMLSALDPRPDTVAITVGTPAMVPAPPAVDAAMDATVALPASSTPTTEVRGVAPGDRRVRPRLVAAALVIGLVVLLAVVGLGRSHSTSRAGNPGSPAAGTSPASSSTGLPEPLGSDLRKLGQEVAR